MGGPVWKYPSTIYKKDVSATPVGLKCETRITAVTNSKAYLTNQFKSVLYIVDTLYNSLGRTRSILFYSLLVCPQTYGFSL